MEVEAHHGFLLTGSQHLHGHPHHQAAGDDECWEYFPCPFCYTEVEVLFLCDHLQEEHCFDMKNAVCPICADNLGTNTDEHFRNQHSHLLTRRKSSSSSKPSQEAADKDTYEEDDDSYFEAPSYIVGKPVPDYSPDPLLSEFICSFMPPIDSEPGEAKEDHASPSLVDPRLNQVVMDDASKQDLKDRLRRTEFVKQMVMTTISADGD